MANSRCRLFVLTSWWEHSHTASVTACRYLFCASAAEWLSPTRGEGLAPEPGCSSSGPALELTEPGLHDSVHHCSEASLATCSHHLTHHLTQGHTLVVVEVLLMVSGLECKVRLNHCLSILLPPIHKTWSANSTTFSTSRRQGAVQTCDVGRWSTRENNENTPTMKIHESILFLQTSLEITKAPTQYF